MYLTRLEEKMLEGEYGEALSDAMRVLVKVGEALGAERLIKINHAHVSGLSYLTIGEPGLLFIESFYRRGARTRVYSTMNPVGMDLERWRSLGVPWKFAAKQERIIDSMIKMGFKESMTCTPYLLREPRRGEHLAWGESSAVGMANTYYGAYTNREGGPLALMAAITGRTYEAGLHLPENRQPTVLVKLEEDSFIVDPAKAGIIGYIVGEQMGTGIPYIKTSLNPGFTSVKAYTAAAGASGGIAYSIIEGVTPGYKQYSDKIGGLEKLVITKDMIEEKLPPKDLKPDLIFIGCPHADLNEIAYLAKIIRDCGSRPSAKIWVSTSRRVYREAHELGLIKYLETMGVLVTRDTCPVVSPMLDKKYKIIATTSSKSFFYIPRMHGIKTYVIPFNSLRRQICTEN